MCAFWRRRATNAYRAHLRRIGTEKPDPVTGEPRLSTRRWVVERALIWRSKCPALLIRYDKHATNLREVFQFACALLWLCRLHCLSLLR